jgi:hypothetical protein
MKLTCVFIHLLQVIYLCKFLTIARHPRKELAQNAACSCGIFYYQIDCEWRQA